MLQESCSVLDMPEPELYVLQTPEVNAFTYGYTKPYIMLYTGLLELLNEDEIMAVIAHEVGHIKCGHVLYSTMAGLLGSLTLQIDRATFGLGVPLYMAIVAALVNWRRLSEYSADRAELVVMQNPRPVITALTKFAGGTHRFADELDPDEFLHQARIYTEEIDQKSFVDQLYRLIAATDLRRSHPFTVERVKEIDLWANGPEYADILAGNYPRGVRRVQIKVQTEV
jgi:Zn-dependent protease with chaperone function